MVEDAGVTGWSMGWMKIQVVQGWMVPSAARRYNWEAVRREGTRRGQEGDAMVGDVKYIAASAGQATVAEQSITGTHRDSRNPLCSCDSVISVIVYFNPQLHQPITVSYLP